MSYQVLARKWRPHSFSTLVGQTHVVKTLINALDSDRLHHAYLFTGTRGVGKTTLARILAACLNCEAGVSSEPCGTCNACRSIMEGRFADLIEVDAASRAKVEETRELMDNVQYAPTSGRYKVYLIDEVHMFSNHSFNALLKTLEEPPPHVKFLLATTEPKKLPITILSRCLQFNLVHLTAEQITWQLMNIVQNEGLGGKEASLQLIATAANGSMRDALSLLDQAIAYTGGKLDEASVRNMLGNIDREEIAALINCLVENDASGMLQHVAGIAAANPDFDAVLSELLSRLHDIAVLQVLPDPAAADYDDFCKNIAGRVSREDVQLYYQIGLNGRRDLAMSPDPRSGFEMTLIRMLAFRPIDSSVAASPAGSGPSRREYTGNETTPESYGREAMAREHRTAPESEESTLAHDVNWQAIMDELALDGLTREFAGHCVLRSHTGDQFHLVLTPAQEHLLLTNQRDRLQQAIRKRYGDHVKLVITVEDVAQETPAEWKIRAEQERQEAAVKAFTADPQVKAIVDTFDATMNVDTIRPR